MALKYMLMGILQDRSLSGYDLNKFFDHVIHYFWTADHSRIYRTLHELHEAGWVEVEHIAQTDTPDKKVYHLTPAGREALRVWLEVPPAPQPNRLPWLGQLFFAGDLDTAGTLRLLEARRALLQAELDVLVQRTPGMAELEAHIRNPEARRAWRLSALTLHYGLTHLRFLIDWLDEAMAMIRAGDGLPAETPDRSREDQA